MTYDAFISYSHAADGELAPALQKGLQRLARRWYRKRAMEVFRDETGLGVSPALWSAIQVALDDAKFFVLLASPDAAASPWVDKEIRHWLTGHPVDRLLPVVTDGDWVWHPARNDFDWERSTAVPPALRGVFREEPLYLDLRWARPDAQLDLRNAQFRDAVAELAAPMHGMTKEDLDSEDVAQHRRVIQLRRGVLAVLSVLLLLVAGSGVMAVRNLHAATASAREASRQQILAEQQRTAAAAYAKEAHRQQQAAAAATANANQQEALAQQATTNARKQEAIARAAQVRAKNAAAEALRQGRAADAAEAQALQAAGEAKKQRQLAADATAAANEANHQAEAARHQGELANHQAKLAKRRAAREQRIAAARRLDGEANAARAGDPRTALMLAIAARRLHADNQTKANLVNALTSTHFAGSVLGDEVPVGALAFAPDGRTLATGGPDARVVLWDTSKGVTFPRRLSRIPSIESYRVSSLTFSPDGHILAVARIGIDDSDGSGYEAVLLSLWDVSDRTHPRRLHRLLFDATDASVTFSPNGRMMAVGQSDLPERGSWVALWDISAPAHPRQLARTLDFDAWTDPIVLAFSSDSRFLATSEDAEVILWNVSGQDRLGESFTSSAVTAIAFSPNGRTLATGNADGTVALLDLTDRAHPRQIGQPPTGHQGSVSTVAFSPDGQTLATGSDDRTVILWNVADRTAPRQMAQLTGHASPVVDMAFSPDGHTLVTSSEGETIAWQVASRAEPRVLRELPTVGGCMRNFSVEGRAYFSADGRTLVVMDDSRLLLVDVANRNIRELSNPWGDCVEAVSPDARTVAAWDGRSEVLWDVTNWAAPRRVGQLFTPDTLEVNAAAFSPDGATIAVGNYRTFAIWNIADRERPRQLARVSIPGLERLTFSPDGRILVAGVERFVRDKDVDSVSLWDVADRRAPRRLGKPLKDQTRVALSPVGHILATGGNDDSVSLWDIAHPARPRRLGRLNHTTLLALSPDGRTLIGGGFDQTVFLWDVTHPADPWRVEQPLTGSTYQKFSDVAFSPDGRTLVADIGGMALMDLGGFYDLRDHAVARACAITGGGLSRADWDLYVPKPLTYQRTCPGSAGATTGQARAAVTRSSLAPQEPAMLNRRYE